MVHVYVDKQSLRVSLRHALFKKNTVFVHNYNPVHLVSKEQNVCRLTNLGIVCQVWRTLFTRGKLNKKKGKPKANLLNSEVS